LDKFPCRILDNPDSVLFFLAKTFFIHFYHPFSPQKGSKFPRLGLKVNAWLPLKQAERKKAPCDRRKNPVERFQTLTKSFNILPWNPLTFIKESGNKKQKIKVNLLIVYS
jgi:hypothetical protein